MQTLSLKGEVSPKATEREVAVAIPHHFPLRSLRDHFPRQGEDRR